MGTTSGAVLFGRHQTTVQPQASKPTFNIAQPSPMLTDNPPRKTDKKEEYQRSDAIVSILLPAKALVRRHAAELEVAMRDEDRRAIEAVCNEIGVCVSERYEIEAPKIRVLGVRPQDESRGMIHETYGDYNFDPPEIRLWMRTAVLEKMTSFGTLLSTLTHELCHHLDVVSLDLPNTFHTRGFYERAGLLYHHVRGTPRRRLVWDKQKNGTYKINWPQTMRGTSITTE